MKSTFKHDKTMR